MTLLRWVVILHACSSFAIISLEYSLAITLSLQLAIVGSLLFSFWCWRKPLWHRVIYKAGCWELMSSSGKNGSANSNLADVYKPVELCQFYHFGQIYVITFKDPNHRAIVKPQINIVLLPDSSDAKSLRQFRRLLLMNGLNVNNQLQKN